jgi:hypothetical protein
MALRVMKVPFLTYRGLLPTVAQKALRFDFFLICVVGGGVQTASTRHVGHSLAYCTCPG